MSFFETQKRARGEREAFQVVEEAREKAWRLPSLLADLYNGRFRPDLILPFPDQDPHDRRIGDDYVKKVEAFIRTHLDADEVDRTGEIPPHVIKGFVELGCLGMKIPSEYGGLGLSQTNYNRVIGLIASHCGSTAVWLSAHQSIGVPQPVMLFGTEEQKRRYLPRLVQGAISGFALTEPDVGSDPARLSTTATPVEDGRAYLLNGQKLWCTNGPIADLLVVMARTPPLRLPNGTEKTQITVFIVERTMPGIELIHRCKFMGLHGMQNGLLRLTNVRVPKENIIGQPGQGLRIAFTTLNAGRITLPAACTAIAKQCLGIARDWTGVRVQWGKRIGEHESAGVRLTKIAVTTYAMDAVVSLVSSFVDRHETDIRLESAMSKLFCSEAGWRVLDHTIQLRGGRGYERADSLKARGEGAVPVERMMRDYRINMIIEGTSTILRLFIAREAFDTHLRRAGDLLNPKLPWSRRARALIQAGLYYAWWYPRQWVSWCPWPKYAQYGRPLDAHLRFVEQTSHRLAREAFHQMLRFGPALEKRQLTLMRLVDVGMYLFVMAAVCAKAARPTEPAEGREMADLFCRFARGRIRRSFGTLYKNLDRRAYRLGQRIMAGDLTWLEDGIIAAEPSGFKPRE